MPNLYFLIPFTVIMLIGLIVFFLKTRNLTQYIIKFKVDIKDFDEKSLYFAVKIDKCHVLSVNIPKEHVQDFCKRSIKLNPGNYFLEEEGFYLVVRLRNKKSKDFLVAFPKAAVEYVKDTELDRRIWSKEEEGDAKGAG